MDEKLVKDICKKSSPVKALHKTDIGAIKTKYDLDRDGQIGLDDFKRMGLV
jgi:hypothetical protein